MALRECKECGKEVSTKADKCPNCGAPIKKKGVGCLGTVIIIVFVIALIGLISNSSTERDKEKARVEDQKNAAELAKKRAAEAAQKRAEEKALAEKQEREKTEFLENIETHYQQLAAHYKGKDFDRAAEVLNLFVLYDKLNYKDVDRIYRKVVIWNIEKELPDVPATDIERNLGLYTQLADLDPTNQKYKQKLKYYTAKDEEQKREASKMGNDLELLSWHWSSDYGYVKAEGQVKNLTGRNLKSVEALVTWYDGNGNMITSRSALIDYNPILPGQTSPFSVMATHNPAMKKASIEFKYLFGGAIPTYHKTK